MPVTFKLPQAPSNQQVISQGPVGKSAPDPTLSLLLDKISVTLQIHGESSQKEMWGHFLFQTKDIESFLPAPIKGQRRYNLNAWMLSPGHGPPKARKLGLFQAGPTKKTDAFMRLEWNPSRLKEDGHVHLASHLDGMLPGGFQQLAHEGRVTRADVAVDIKGRHIKDLLILAKGVQAWTTIGTMKNGAETLYLGSPTSYGQWRTYDKVLQMSVHDPSAYKMLLPGTEITRLERTQHTSKSIATLGKLTNPLSKLSIVDVSQLKTVALMEPYVWRLFLAAARAESVKSAVACLPFKFRGAVLSAINGSPASWWKPQTLWGDWAKLLHELNFEKL